MGKSNEGLRFERVEQRGNWHLYAKIDTVNGERRAKVGVFPSRAEASAIETYIVFGFHAGQMSLERQLTALFDAGGSAKELARLDAEEPF